MKAGRFGKVGKFAKFAGKAFSRASGVFGIASIIHGLTTMAEQERLAKEQKKKEEELQRKRSKAEDMLKKMLKNRIDINNANMLTKSKHAAEVRLEQLVNRSGIALDELDIIMEIW